MKNIHCFKYLKEVYVLSSVQQWSRPSKVSETISIATFIFRHQLKTFSELHLFLLLSLIQSHSYCKDRKTSLSASPSLKSFQVHIIIPGTDQRITRLTCLVLSVNWLVYTATNGPKCSWLNIYSPDRTLQKKSAHLMDPKIPNIYYCFLSVSNNSI